MPRLLDMSRANQRDRHFEEMMSVFAGYVRARRGQR
jgi:hypothetical protein